MIGRVVMLLTVVIVSLCGCSHGYTNYNSNQYQRTFSADPFENIANRANDANQQTDPGFSSDPFENIANKATRSYNKQNANNNCCKICRKGKACGNSCISRSYTCHKPVGCACNG